MNIAQITAYNLLDKHSLPFISVDESDFLIARNSAIHEINYMRECVGLFQQDFWNDVHEEILKINYQMYLNYIK